MSETFDAGWLELREPVDHRSRARELLEPLQTWWSGRSGTEVLDLGCGTGSNLRYLSPHLSGARRWTLIDHDAALLARIRAPGDDVTLRVLRRDLVGSLLPEIGEAHLVSASALLDLVSESWLAELVEACAAAGSAALFALTYDGRIEWSSDRSELDGDDAVVMAAVNAHQRRDKGFGAALGPAASGAVERLFRAQGYETSARASDWVLGPADSALVHALIDGWERAATEECTEQAELVRAWAARRRGAVEREAVTLRVGHRDVLAVPPDRRPR